MASTKDFENKKVWTSRPSKNDSDAVKKVGRIHSIVFHPKKPKIVGFLVKRPDVAWMFRREDAFVAFNGLELLSDDKGNPVLLIKDDPQASGKGALKAANVKIDDCIIWIGLPAMCPDGKSLGVIDAVEFDDLTGKVLSVQVSQGATANTLLGRRSIPGSMVLGFKRGMGAKLVLTDEDDDPESLGAIVVGNEARDLPVEGGFAEKAGEATAVATDKVQKTYKKVVKKAKPAASDAAKAAGEAVQKGAFATGRQIARTEGMFGRFKDEFTKAMNDKDGK